MISFGSRNTFLIILSYFALGTLAVPAQRQYGPWSGPASYPAAQVSAVPAPSTTAADLSHKKTVASSSPSSNPSSNPSTDSDLATTDSTKAASSDLSKSSGAGSGTPGYATIVNKCNFPTYLYVCIQVPAGCGANHTLAANTGTYSEAYGAASEKGHSLKISKKEGSTDIMQFEYTNEGNGNVNYDISLVNGNPFGSYGFTLTNTTKDAYCAPPATNCKDIFTDPTNGTPYTAPISEGTGAILCG